MRAALALTGTHVDAQDLVQQACLQMWRSWSRVSSAADPLAYAHRVLINAHLSERRRRHWRLERLTPEIPDRGRDADVGVVESADALRDALAGLPARQRAAVVLRYVLDYDDTAAAEALGCSASTVRSQISRALERLREQSAAQEVPDGT